MNLRTLLFILLSCITGFVAQAQFAPQAGITGSTAIFYTSPDLVGWGTDCTLWRGLKQINVPDSGYVTSGDSSLAIGMADNLPVSLGDSGVATLTFAAPLYDGPGADFAVFENGFANPANPEEAFLELAFVEVSSDGEHFFRFPATSLTDTTTQIPGAGVYLNARDMDNLAGKYIGRYGTPFDLAALPEHPLLNKQAITHVRVIDVIGDIGRYGSTDAGGRKINDPFPTNFPTGGFDLDAIGAIHQLSTSIHNLAETNQPFVIAPNPARNYIHFVSHATEAVRDIIITDIQGKVLLRQESKTQSSVDISHLPTGMYIIRATTNQGNTWQGRFSHL